MKNLKYIIILIGLGILVSCEKELRDPKLDMNQATAPSFSSPANGTAYVLTSEQSGEVLTVFQWSDAMYNLSDLPATSYVLQMDLPGNNFASPVELVKATETSFEIKVGTMNSKLTTMGVEVGVASDVEFRIFSNISANTDYTDLYSSVMTLNFTTYEDVVVEKYIYLLGDGTPAGWDNTAALQMADMGEGKYARVETLDPGVGDYFKFISVLGFWAPQWGTDATGTPEAGPLVYRPDEATPDPAAIPVPTEAGNYYIEADTVNLTYSTFLTSGELYLVGSATTAGWDNTLGLPFTEAEPHIFEITTDLIDGGMKFLEVLGQWAPQWGTDDTADGTGGPLLYRKTESVPDPAEVPSPGTGTFTIRVDMTTMTYTIQAK